LVIYMEVFMYICYVEESGDTGAFNPSFANSNPAFAIIGVFIGHFQMRDITKEFLYMKHRFYPNLYKEHLHLDRILIERKGCALRKSMRSDSKSESQTAIGFIDSCVRLLEQYDAKLLGRVLIKQEHFQYKDAAVYGAGVMHICEHFNYFLNSRGEYGMILADGRRYAQNQRTTHSIFTQIHAHTYNFQKLVEAPAYGNSCNFALLQLSDIICSAVLFPMVMDAYGGNLRESGNVQANPKYQSIRMRYMDSKRYSLGTRMRPKTG